MTAAIRKSIPNAQTAPKSAARPASLYCSDVSAAKNPEATNSDRVECMLAQASTCTTESDIIDKFGRHESSRSQLLLQYVKKADRIQTIRRALEFSHRNITQTSVNKPFDPKTASFCKMPLRQFAEHNPTICITPDKLKLHQCQTAPTASHT